MSKTTDMRRGMLGDLARRIALCNDDELDMVDRNLLVIERAREHREAVIEWDADDHHATRPRAELGGEA